MVSVIVATFYFIYTFFQNPKKVLHTLIAKGRVQFHKAHTEPFSALWSFLVRHCYHYGIVIISVIIIIIFVSLQVIATFVTDSHGVTCVTEAVQCSLSSGHLCITDVQTLCCVIVDYGFNGVYLPLLHPNG